MMASRVFKTASLFKDNVASMELQNSMVSRVPMEVKLLTVSRVFRTASLFRDNVDFMELRTLTV